MRNEEMEIARMKKETWKAIIQIAITILTAISSTIVVQSCGLLD